MYLKDAQDEMMHRAEMITITDGKVGNLTTPMEALKAEAKRLGFDPERVHSRNILRCDDAMVYVCDLRRKSE